MVDPVEYLLNNGWLVEPMDVFTDCPEVFERLNDGSITIYRKGNDVRLLLLTKAVFETELRSEKRFLISSELRTHYGSGIAIGIQTHPRFKDLKHPDYPDKYQRYDSVKEYVRNALVFNINELARQQCGLINCVEEIFSWKNISKSIAVYDDILNSEKNCSECGCQTVLIHYDEDCFKSLGGCNVGTLEICPVCMRQLYFKLERQSIKDGVLAPNVKLSCCDDVLDELPF